MSRVEIKKERSLNKKIFGAMLWIALFGLIAETLTFVIDGMPGEFIHFLQYFTNAYLFLATSLISVLWVIFVDFYIFRSISRIKKWFGHLIVLWLMIAVLIFCDLFGAGFIFSINSENVYMRGSLSFLSFGFVFLCYFLSLVLAILAVKRHGHIRFFPVHYFVLPSLFGTIIQGVFYGLAVGWLCLSVALLFIQLHIAKQIEYEDELSGLYNRKYFGRMVEKLAKSKKKRYVSAILIDIDNFKNINDMFGHSTGDEVIRSMGKVLTYINNENTLAFRVGGDEFIVLHVGGQEDDINQLRLLIEQEINEFNESEENLYKLSVSMGLSTCKTECTNLDSFFHELDLKMYEEKVLKETT